MRPEGTKPGRKVSWPVLVALFLVPLLMAASLIGLVGTDDDEKITAAIVNLDEGTEIDGQFVPMGRQLAGEMMEREGHNIRWILADRSSADEGLLSGEYSAAVTIPANFSSAAMSFAANDADQAQKARVDVTISDNAPAGDAALAQEIARIATRTLNDMLTAQYLEGIYLGFNEMGSQFSQISDGVTQLQDGSGQLADGLGQAAGGTDELVDGMRQLADGSGELTSGGDQLADGSAGLVDGASQLAAGAGQLNAGVQEMASQMPQLTGGIGQLADGAEQLLPGVAQYTEGTGQVVGGIGQLADGLGQVVDGMDSADMDFSEIDQLVGGSAELADGAGQVADGLDQFVDSLQPLDGIVSDDMVAAVEGIQQQAAELGGFVRDADTALQAYANGSEVPAEVTQLAEQLKAGFQCPVEDPELCEQIRAAYEQGIDDSLVGGFQQGAGAASDFLNTPEPGTGLTYLELADRAGSELAEATGPIVEGLGQAQQILPGLEQLRDGSRAVADGNQQLADGIALMADELPTQLASEMGTLRDGIAQLRDGADALAVGAQPLVENGTQLADGSNQLLGGIRELASQVGALPEGVQQLADGTAGLSQGASALSDGLGQYSTGVLAFVDGVWQFSDGVGQAANGAGELADGLNQLDDGMGELNDGISTFADELAAGQDQLPSYSESDRERLAEVVSSPVEAGDDTLERGTVAASAVILISGLWLAALAAFVVTRAVPSDVVRSRATSVALWARTVGVPTAIVAATGVVLGLILGAALSLSAGTVAGLIGILVLLGVLFTCTQHALAAWLGHIGRGIAVVLLAVTVALGLSSSLPGWLDPVASVSPVHSGMLLTRSWLAGADVVTSVAGVVLVTLLMAALSWGAIAARRKLTPARFQSRHA